MTASDPGRLRARLRGVVYWAATAIIALESAVGGVWDVLRTDYVVSVLEDLLGYPPYVAVLLGLWKLPGAAVLVLPRLPRLKEWVYAGVMFVYLGASASHLLVGDVAGGIGPLGFATITAISWALRPEDRRRPGAWSERLTRLAPRPPQRTRTVVGLYWGATVTVCAVLFSGGVADLVGRPDTVAGMEALGYPAYFLYVIGFWKVLAPLALLPRGFGRLKEWAYAGAFFNFSGAVVSHLVSDSQWHHVAYTAAFAVLTLVSWALRPPDRILGALLPARERTSS